MSRNGSGAMSIPNTMVAGTTITASDHNENYSDIGTELTNSVAADGQTTMTGPLKASNGTAAAPSLTFGSDPDTGFYRDGANSIGAAVAGAKVLDIGTGGMSLTGLNIIGATSIAPATTDTVPIYDLSGTANGRSLISDILALSSTSLPRGYIDGCIISNGTDTTNDINISAGVCRDSTNAVNITLSAITGKQLDANWVAGSAAGMRNSGVGIANDTYHIWAVRTADSEVGDIYAHTSTTAATVLTALQAELGGASYAYARLIASIVRAGATILQFTQYGNYFQLTTPVVDVTTAASGTSANTGTLASVPNGIAMKVNLNVNTNVIRLYVSALTATDQIPDDVASPISTLADTGVGDQAALIFVYVNSSRQFRYRTSTNGSVRFATLGWEHPRGRDS